MLRVAKALVPENRLLLSSFLRLIWAIMPRKFLFGLSFFSMQLWLGASLFLSFILAPVLFATFGAELGADVMGAVFPAYGYLHFVCAAMGLVGFALAWKARGRIGARVYFPGLAVLVLTLVLVSAQAFYVFPRSHQLRGAVKAGRAAGSLDGIAPQASELMRLHSVSIGINNATILALLFLAWVYYRVARDWDKT